MPGGRTTDVEYTEKSSKTRSMKRWSVIKSKKVCDKKIICNYTNVYHTGSIHLLSEIHICIILYIHSIKCSIIKCVYYEMDVCGLFT